MSWQKTLIKIISSDSDDLVYLARIAGYDPKEFYESADFHGVRIKGSEIAALEVPPERLEGAEIIEDNIDPRRDEEARALLEQLISSKNFAETHSIVARLLQLGPFSGAAIDLYIFAVEGNNQVNWIMEDLDLVDLAAKIDSSPAVHYSAWRLNRLRALRSKYGPGREEPEPPSTPDAIAPP